MVESITVNAHSSIRIASDRIMYFDPFMIENAVFDADIVFITHTHYDHFSPEDIEKIKNPGTVFIMPFGEKSPYENTVFLKPGEQAEICEHIVKAVPAYNVGKPFHPKENGWLGYVVEALGKRIYVAGDTDENEDNVNVSCDIALLPCGGKYTMNAKEAADFANKIKSQTAIPTHYGAIVGEKDCGAVFAGFLDKNIKSVIKI